MRIKSKKSQREYGLLNSSDLKAAKYKLLYGIMYAIMIIIAQYHRHSFRKVLIYQKYLR